MAFSDLTDQQKESLRGKSAYAYAQDGGFTGTEEAFAEKLAAEYPAFADVRAAAPPHNLLDNSDFTNPVAQAGVGGKHGNQAYALDRWILTSGSVSHQAGVGLTLNGTITQKLEHLPTGSVSTFVGKASGQASISYSGRVVTISSSGGVIVWAALYHGAYTEETKPEYRPKGYAAELLECKRYYQENWVPYFSYVANNNAIPGINYPVKMRTNPTVEIYDESGNKGYIGTWGQQGVYKVSAAPSDDKRVYYVMLENYPGAQMPVVYRAVSFADL